MPYKDKRVKSLSWFFRFAIPTGISENLGEFVLGTAAGTASETAVAMPAGDAAVAAPADLSFFNVLCLTYLQPAYRAKSDIVTV